MNTNEHDGTNEPSEEGRVHTMLCAYVLGEASGDERAEVEQLLEGSAELRAERERLEATIGLVRTSLGGEDALPAASASLLTEALAAQQKQRWYRLPAVRLAAAAGVLGLVWVGWQASTREQVAPFNGPMFGDGLAVADAPARVSAPESKLEGGKALQLDGEVLRQLESLGYTGGDARASRSGLGEKDASFEKAGNEAVVAGIERPEVFGDAFEGGAGGGASRPPADGPADFSSRRAAGRSAPVVDAATLDRLKKLGYVEEQPAAEPAPAASRARVNTLRDENSPSLALAASIEPSKPASGPASPAGAPSRSSRKSKGGLAVTGSDDFFLGRGARDGAEVSSEALEKLRELGYLDSDEGDNADRIVGLRFAHSEYERSKEELSARRFQRRVEFILGSCTRRPNELPRDMFFRFWGDNPFEWTAIDAQSTFSVDVDTASYTLARRYLAENRLPTKAQIRTEEFVNYFDADVPAPLESTFRIATEIAPARFGEGPDSWMLRVAVRGKDVSREERQPLTLTFVVDVSGSMKENNRMELVKHALRLLIGELDARDSISLVAFSKEARLILPMTSAVHRSLIETAIHQLQPDGGTNAEAGLMLGYEQAAAFLAENTHNRVVLLSDGVANIGNTDQETLTRNVERHRKAGIYLNTVGVGMGNHNDALLEQLANKGDGICNYVDDAAEARRALVERYRLLGYENRAIADADFRNDRIDAGEVNAGHQVVALYELVGTPASDAGPLATVRLRWKPPHLNGVASVETDAATETEQSVSWGAVSNFQSASLGYRRSVLVAQFAEFLRRSTHARADSLDQLIAEAKALDAVLEDEDFTEFVELVERSRMLVLSELNRYDDLERALDAIRQSAYLQSQLEDLSRRLGRGGLGLEAAVTRLEERLEWMRALLAADELSIDRAELEALERENARLRDQVRRLLELLLEPKPRVR